MNKLSKEVLTEYSLRAGLRSSASAALLSLPQFSSRAGDDSSGFEVRSAWHAAQEERNDLLILEKNVLTRASPTLPQAVRLGLRHPDVSLRDYEEWFGRPVVYANPGDISSVFSPAAYLCEMYREAQYLYPQGSRYSIGTRRPDLAELVLSQKNMDEEVTALSLSNEILMPHVRNQLVNRALMAEDDITDDGVLQALAEHAKSIGTPWHYHYSRLRHAILQKDPDFCHLLAAPDATGHLSGAARAALHFNISPALYEMLIKDITKENAESLYNSYFPTIHPQLLLTPQYLRDWYGLTDEELQKFELIADLGTYRNKTMTTLIEGNFYRITLTGFNNNDTLKVYPLSDETLRVEGVTKFSGADGYALCPGYSGTNPTLRWKNDLKEYFHNEPFSITLNMKDAQPSEANATFQLSGADSLRIGKWWPDGDKTDSEFHLVKWNIIPLGSAYVYALKLNKAIRLYKASGIAPRVLEDVAGSVNADLTITADTLALLSQTDLLMKRYSISHEDALVMAKGYISQKPGEDGISHWDRLFNSPLLTETPFSATGGTVSLLPEKTDEFADIKAVLKRAMQMDDYGLSCLQMICDTADTKLDLSLEVEQISALYTLSLWAHHHGLTPGELKQVLEIIGLGSKLDEEDKGTWQRLLEKLDATMRWLSENRWSLTELLLLTRPAENIPAGPEILNFLEQTREYILGAGEVAEKDRLARLAPFISGVYSLNSDSAAEAIIIWTSNARPGGWTLNEFWSSFIAKAETPDVQAVAFACALSQRVLFAKKTAVPVDAMSLFVKQPAALGPEAAMHDEAVLDLSLYTVQLASEFSNWLRTLPVPDEALSVMLTTLGSAGLTAAQLASVTNFSEVLITQAMAVAWPAELHSPKISDFAAIRMVTQWLTLSKAYDVTPHVMGQMIALDYADGPLADWDSWKRVANAFTAGLSQSQARGANGIVQEELSAALCGFLLNSDSDFPDIKDREQLYQYLLADNLNGAQITTSRVAHAIMALQTFIHRTLFAPEEPGAMLRDGPGRQFFLDWNLWNSRYSNWGAYRKLMYYPENYIDPTVRLGQTRMMDEMLQSLGQAQINEDTVGDAFMGYLTSFEEVANLTTLCGYHDNPDPASGKTYFIGHNQAGTREYWWRTVDEGKRDENTGQLPANAWSGWEKITSSPQVWNDCVRPVVYKSRLYLVWLERQYTPVSDVSGIITDKWRWLLKLSGLRYDANWTEPVVEDVTKELDLLHSKAGDEIGFFVSNWAPTGTLMVAVYDLKQPYSNLNGDSTHAAGWTILDNMEISAFENIDNTLKLLEEFSQLMTVNQSPVINRYIGSQVVGYNKWVSSGTLPLNFEKLELDTPTVDVSTSDDDKKYTVTVKARATMKYKLKQLDPEMLAKLTGVYPGIRDIKSECDVSTASNLDEENPYNLIWIGSEDRLYIYGRGLVRNASGEKPLSINISPVPGFWNIEPINTIEQDDGTFDFYTSYEYKPGYLTIWQHPLISLLYCYDDDDGYHETLKCGHIFYVPTLKDKMIPAEDPSLSPMVKKESITVAIDSGTRSEAKTDWDRSKGEWTGEFLSTSENYLIEDLADNTRLHRVILNISGLGIREYEFKVERQIKDGIVVTLQENKDTGVQYLKFGDDKRVTRLNTQFARQLTERATTGIATILNWDTQQIKEPPMIGDESTLMDFTGANGIYFWELFYYTPMMVMQRFLQEERFDLAEQWLQYVFNPGGYMDGLLRSDRIWNVRPLEEDTSWNDSPLESWDPDAVAQNDPMHYKLNAFMRLLDITIGRGDAAYRRLERDTMAEAKVWYSRALNLLGDRPWIDHNATWSDPQLGDVASETRHLAHIDTLSAMCKGEVRPERLQAGITAGDLFSMEANEMMLGYWDTLRLRLFNLRHNLTIDGQPLNLPLYTAIADPKALLAAAVAAEAGAGSVLPVINTIPALRFTPLLETARSMASQLIQFGSSMQQILQGYDSAEMAHLLSQQGAELADSNLALQKQVMKELDAERVSIERNLDTVTARRNYYQALYDENINSRELQAMNLLTSSQALSAGIKPLHVAAAAANVAPNIFGLANGGMEYGGPLTAVGIGMEIAVAATSIAGSRITQEEQYRRRRQEWEIQYRTAETEIETLKAQQALLDVRVTSAHMQITQMEMQTAQTKAQLALLQSQFTFKTMYSWMRSRLATIFYQYYDLTASCCLMAQKALQWEKQDTAVYLRTGTWSGAWAGLMSGEGLMLSLAQMEMAWMKHQKREMEVTRTVSLKSFFDEKLKDDNSSLTKAIHSLLESGRGEFGTGLNKVELSQDQLALHFSLADFALARDFNGKNCRIRSIAVTLPALLGPYQNIRGRLRTNVSAAELPAGCHECAISHAMHDNGLFANDGSGDPRWGARWLPFEGLDLTDESGMTLSFADATGDQKALLESLSDVILHIQFTVR